MRTLLHGVAWSDSAKTSLFLRTQLCGPLFRTLREAIVEQIKGWATEYPDVLLQTIEGSFEDLEKST
tara:strand:- start:304 stop:504 length:201 start_codon:yes stop_codon:yes gene_type:complete